MDIIPETLMMIRKIAWFVAIFCSGMFAGYVLKLAIMNYERIQAQKEEKSEWIIECLTF